MGDPQNILGLSSNIPTKSDDRGYPLWLRKPPNIGELGTITLWVYTCCHHGESTSTSGSTFGSPPKKSCVAACGCFPWQETQWLKYQSKVVGPTLSLKTLAMLTKQTGHGASQKWSSSNCTEHIIANLRYPAKNDKFFAGERRYSH